MNRTQTHRYSFSVTTPIIDYSGDSAWMLRYWSYVSCALIGIGFYFEKLDGCSVIMDDVAHVTWKE